MNVWNRIPAPVLWLFGMMLGLPASVASHSLAALFLFYRDDMGTAPGVLAAGTIGMSLWLSVWPAAPLAVACAAAARRWARHDVEGARRIAWINGWLWFVPVWCLAMMALPYTAQIIKGFLRITSGDELLGFIFVSIYAHLALASLGLLVFAGLAHVLDRRRERLESRRFS